MNNSNSTVPAIEVLGVTIHMVDVSDAANIMSSWIQDQEPCRFVVNTGMHGLMEGCRSAEFKKILNSANLFTPDGFSVVWLGRRRGYPLKRRVSGADLMRECLRISEKTGYKHFFYGDTPETLKSLEAKLKSEFPRLNIVGTLSPPFRELTPNEIENERRIINDSGCDVLWVGLGLPKQEQWISQNMVHLNASVAIGVGASFKFLSGKVKRAPAIMGENGLEWIWRFAHEPRRMWRRALIDTPHFIFYLILERMGLKHFGTHD